MKRLTAFFTIIFFMMLPSTMAQAKSYTIDEVQIKGWIQPNGDMLVNEIFTYSFDGAFTELSRSFPERHIGQIDGFEAYLLDTKNPVVGEISDSMLTRLNVTKKGETRTSTINAKDKTITVFYVYNMRGAVKSYDTYSDLDVTFFEQYDNHDTDLNNVSITFVLPGGAGESNVHGFMHDRKGGIEKVYTDGIIFTTPKSEAYGLTATRVLFPSSIMTEQEKGVAPIPLEKVIVREEQRIKAHASQLALIPTAEGITNVITALFIVIALLVLLLRQRSIPFFGSVHHVLQTDPVYLSFVDRNGTRQPKNFLAGIFAMAEKGLVDVRLESSAERFKGQAGAPEKTLAFHLNKSTQSLLPFEKTLVIWLFKTKLANRKFHLHDIAGAADDGKNRTKSYEKKQHHFERIHGEWHAEVKQLMDEAGTLSAKVPAILKWAVFLVLAATIAFASYADGGGGWEIALPFIVTGIIFYWQVRRPYRPWIPIVYFIVMFFVAAQVVDADLLNRLIMLVFASALLYFVTPRSIITSTHALYTKMSIAKFRSQIRHGLPHDLTEEEQERWLTRAYLLNKSKSKLPRMKGPLPAMLPIAALFAMETDPLHFVQSTWGPSKIAKASSGGYDSGGSYHSDGGGYSGGGGDGGGAGAD